MLKKLLIICDSEKKYAERLAEYLRKRRELNYDIWTFSDIDTLVSVELNRRVDVLLIEETQYKRFMEYDSNTKKLIGKLAVLSSDKYECTGNESSIYKYQSATKIMDKLLEECLDYGIDGFERDEKNFSEIIGVYSPVKRSLKTTFSYTLAHVLSEKESTLFLNLEGCSGFSSQLSFDTNINLADLLYDFSIHRDEYPERFFNFIQRVDEIGIIPPVETISEIQCIPSSEWISMLRRIRRNGVYKKIVLDIGDNVNGIIDILRMCDVIYMPVRDDYMSIAKLNSFESAIRKYDSSDNLLDKIIKLSFPEFSDTEMGLTNVKYSQLGGYIRDFVQKNKTPG